MLFHCLYRLQQNDRPICAHIQRGTFAHKCLRRALQSHGDLGADMTCALYAPILIISLGCELVDLLIIALVLSWSRVALAARADVAATSQLGASSLDLRKVRHGAGGFANLVEKLEPVFA